MLISRIFETTCIGHQGNIRKHFWSRLLFNWTYTYPIIMLKSTHVITFRILPPLLLDFFWKWHVHICCLHFELITLQNVTSYLFTLGREKSEYTWEITFSSHMKELVTKLKESENSLRNTTYFMQRQFGSTVNWCKYHFGCLTWWWFVIIWNWLQWIHREVYHYSHVKCSKAEF